MSRLVREPDFGLCENKGADQLFSNCTADQLLSFLLHGLYNSSSTYTQNFKLLALFCDCTDHFVSDLIGNINCWFFHAKAHILHIDQDPVVRSFIKS